MTVSTLLTFCIIAKVMGHLAPLIVKTPTVIYVTLPVDSFVRTRHLIGIIMVRHTMSADVVTI